MNGNQIMNMIIRMVMRKVINGGLNAGIKRLTGGQSKQPAPSQYTQEPRDLSPEDVALARKRAANQAAKAAKRANNG